MAKNQPEIFRIDCAIEPFHPRTINGLHFEPCYDNARRPKIATGIFYFGEATDDELALYVGLEHFTVTRLAAEVDDAKIANVKVAEERARHFVLHGRVPLNADVAGAAAVVEQTSAQRDADDLLAKALAAKAKADDEALNPPAKPPASGGVKK